MGRGWGDFDVVTGEVADDDSDGWTPLPHNGWGALVAFVAGPAHVRGVRRPPGPTRVVCERGGLRESFLRPASQEDLEMIQDGIVGYLSESRTPPPPAGVTWEIRLPPGMTEVDLDRGVDSAMCTAHDLDFPAQKAAVAAYLGGVLAGRASGRDEA